MQVTESNVQNAASARKEYAWSPMPLGIEVRNENKKPTADMGRRNPQTGKVILSAAVRTWRGLLIH